MELVTVIIPCKNGAGFLPGLLANLDMQIRKPDLVLIIDDHSRMPITHENLQYSGSLKVQIILNDGQGVSAARNTGMRMVRFGKIAFLDCDDRWNPMKLKMQLNLMSIKLCKMSCVGYRQINDKGGVIQERTDSVAFLSLPEVLKGSQVVLGSASSVVIDSSLVHTVGFFDESLSLGEDFDYWVRLLQETQCLVISDILVDILRHDKSTQDSLEEWARVRQEIDALIYIFNKIDGYREEKVERLIRLLIESFVRGNLNFSFLFSTGTKRGLKLLLGGRGHNLLILRITISTLAGFFSKKFPLARFLIARPKS